MTITKKLIVAAFSLALLGAGCQAKINQPEKVTGPWWLAFDLPEGWVMVTPYTLEDPIDLSSTVTRTDSEIWLQSTSKMVYLTSGYKPNDDELTALGINWDEDVTTQDYILIKITHLDSRRLIPEGAEDLGNGFSRVKLCEDNEDCRIGGQYNYDYYFTSAGGEKFKFNINLRDKAASEAEHVIMSAKVVTQ